MVSGVTRGGAVTSRFRTPSVIIRRIGGGSRRTPTTIPTRTQASRDAWFRSRGITDTTPAGRDTKGNLLFITSSGQVLSTNDLSLLTPAGKEFVRLTIRTKADVRAGIRPSLEEGIQREKAISQANQERKNQIRITIKEINRKLQQSKTIFQRDLIQKEGRQKINLINQKAKQLGVQLIQSRQQIKKPFIETRTSPVRVKEKGRKLQETKNWFTKRKSEANIEINKLESKINKLKREGKKKEAFKELRLVSKKLRKWKNERTSAIIVLRIVDTIEGLKMIPSILREIRATKGKAIIPLTVALANGIWDDWDDTWQLAKTSPDQALAKVGTDFLTFKFIGGTLKITGKVTGKVATRLNPKFKSFNKNIINIKAPKEIFTRRGKDIFLTKRVGKFRTPIDIIKGRKTGQFKKFQKARGITLKKGLLTDNAKTLAEQAKLAGTKGTIVTAQADRLVNFLRRKKLIRKPIPNEANFSSITKSLLKKFDEGRISKREFYKLNKLVLKESGKTMLERTLFADPNGLVRFTRLGEGVAEASLRDIFRGNFSFKKSRPQILVFPEGKIAKFPKSLRDIVNKLKSGRKLTPNERSRLVQWQTKKGSGKWKPIGDTEYKGGIELEVTLAPGETIRRVKRLAITEINGVKVDIVQAEIIKLKPSTVKLLNKAKRGSLPSNELKKLRSALSKETKLPVSTKDIKNLNKFIKKKSFKFRRRTFAGKPVIPVKRIVITRGVVGARAIRISRRKSVRKKITRRKIRKKPIRRKPIKRKPRARKKPSRRRTPPRKPRPPKRPSKRPPKRPVKRPPRRPPKRPPRRPPRHPPKRPTPPIRIKFKFKKRTIKKKVPVFFVKEKIRGRVVNLTPKPLTLRDAKDFLTYRLDNRLSRSGWFEPLGKSRNIVIPPKVMKGYFNKHRKKFRPFKIRVGKRKVIRNGYIEKKKYIGDTKSEIRQLQASRKRKPKKRIRRKPVRRKRKIIKRKKRK